MSIKQSREYELTRNRFKDYPERSEIHSLKINIYFCAFRSAWWKYQPQLHPMFSL